MTSKKVDQILVFLGLVLIFISSYQLFWSRLHGQKSGLSLGTLEHTEAVVKIKNLASLDWQDAYIGSEVSEEQLIYTDEDSAAEVKFLKGHEVHINENSLVKISSIKQNGGVNVERGLIRATISGDEPLVVEVNGAELKLTGQNADVQISLQGDQSEIGVISGEVAVEKEGQVEKIDQQTSLKVDENSLKKQTISYTLLEPATSSVLYTLDEKMDVGLKWQPESAATILIATDPAFKKVTKHESASPLVLNLKPGSYYWKVEDANGASLTGTFAIVRELPVEILRPKNGEKIRLARAPGAETFIHAQWKGKAGDEYTIEWEDSELHAQKSNMPGYQIPVTQSGALKWRVKAASEKRTLAQWSEWQNLEVDIIEAPAAPTDLMPQELELQSYSKEEQEVELSWKASGAVELEVLEPKNKKTTLVLSTTSHLLKIKEPGEYRWRVRGKDEFDRTSEWSEFKTFKLEDLSHEVSGEGFQRIQLKKPDQAVTFNWKAEQGTDTVFELSEGKDFSDVIIKKQVPGSEVKITVPKTGNFYWRSRQYKTDGTFEVSEPKKVIIEPAPAPGKPEKLPDMEVPLEWQETSIHKKSILDYFISSAYADEIKGIAKIQLPVNEDAKKYVIRIYQDDDGEELVFERTLEVPKLEWENPKAGKYYWQYAIIDHWNRQSPFSDLSVLNVTGTEPIFPEKPKLIKPIRATEVEDDEIEFEWTESDKNKNYQLEISQDENFEKIIYTQKTKKNEFEVEKPAFKPGLHYWRITAMNDSKKVMLSNTGRFTVKPPLEKITIVDKPEAFTKKYNTRWSIAWAPSSDTYDFEGEDQKGAIDGNALNGIELKGQYFGEKIIFSGEVLRQSGKVFEGESYLFQRILLNGTWKKKKGNHLWGPGLSVGSVSGYAYEVVDEEVSPSSVSGLVYGPHIQGNYALSEIWELQGRAAYLLGEIPHMEIIGEGLRQMKNYYLQLGFGYSMREYKKGEGSQTSMRLILGVGKEF